MYRLTLAWHGRFRAHLPHVRVAWEVVNAPVNSRVDLHTAGWWWGPPNMCVVIIPSRTWPEYNDPKTVTKCRDKILYFSDGTLVRDACAFWKTERRKSISHFRLQNAPRNVPQSYFFFLLALDLFYSNIISLYFLTCLIFPYCKQHLLSILRTFNCFKLLND